MSTTAAVAAVTAAVAANVSSNAANTAATTLHMNDAPAPEGFGIIACVIIVVGLIVFGQMAYYYATESNAWHRLVRCARARRASVRATARAKERTTRWGASK